MPASYPIQFPGLRDESESMRAGVNGTAANVQAETPTKTLGAEDAQKKDPLLTAEAVAQRLNVTKDWVWDHSSRKAPYLPVIRMGDGTLRYRASRIEEFIDQRERLTQIRKKRA